MSSIFQLLDSVIINPKRSIKFIIQLLIILFIFSLLILIPLWIAKKTKILPLSSNIILEDTRSKIQLSNVIEEEQQYNLIDNVSISAEVMTFDNLSLNESEKSKIINIVNSLKNNDIEVSENLNEQKNAYIKGFDLIQRWNERSFPVSDISFKRFSDLFSDPSINENLSTSERKKIILSEIYWKAQNNGVKILALPEEKQHSVTVLKITGVTNNGALYLSNDSKSVFSNALKKSTGQNFITVPNVGQILILCMVEGERINFESKNYNWDISISKILNMPIYRNDKDVTLVDYSYTSTK
ncbi:hypothetical protein [Flavobacterium sp. 25HG05S-40]|uniref:hypothetical protein n=1 Tax=Flavobacterium sp. 25HG05S-40 TaxID=3458682 RepID=UPI004044F720